MWEYKIYKTNLGYGVRKTNKVGDLSITYFLNKDDEWTLTKSTAKTFYRKDDAAATLGLMKIKDSKK